MKVAKLNNFWSSLQIKQNIMEKNNQTAQNCHFFLDMCVGNLKLTKRKKAKVTNFPVFPVLKTPFDSKTLKTKQKIAKCIFLESSFSQFWQKGRNITNKRLYSDKVKEIAIPP